MAIRIKESDFQKSFVARMRKDYPYLIPVCIENETNTHAAYNHTAHGYAMGKLAGAADLMILNTRDNIITFIEMKAYNILKNGNYSTAGDQSIKQKAFQEIVESMGFEYILMWNPLQMKEFLKR